MRYWRPYRLLLLHLADHIPSWAGDKILDYLYPDDCLITFLPKEENKGSSPNEK